MGDPEVSLFWLLTVGMLFMPGHIFKRFYYQGKFAKQFAVGIFAERFITSIFWGFVIQCITLFITNGFVHPSYALIVASVSRILDCFSKKQMPDPSVIAFMKHLGLYELAVIFVAMGLGQIFHKIVRWTRIDVKYHIFRFSNHWHYYFKGEISPLAMKGRIAKSAYLDLVTKKEDGKTKLYTGYLADYTLLPDGNLETIVLTNAARWSTSGNVFKEIPGNCFVIPYDKVINLNVRYRLVEKDDYGVIIAFRICAMVILFLIPTLVIYFYHHKLNFASIVDLILSGLMEWIMICIAIIAVFDDFRKKTKWKSGWEKFWFYVAVAVLLFFFGSIVHRLI